LCLFVQCIIIHFFFFCDSRLLCPLAAWLMFVHP
jgi:hypothetical protein